MNPSLSLRQRLLDAERDFLAVRGISALHAFEQQWSTLCEDFQRALDDGLVDDDTKSLAHGVLTRVVLVGEDLAALEKISMSATEALMTELDTLFTQLTIKDLYQPPKKSPRKLRTATAAVHRKNVVPASSPSLTYLPPAWNWLLRNLHDPYPSEATKRLLAVQAAIDVRTLESWFKSARSQIGWVSIYKKRFRGSRRMAETVARAIFLENDGNLDIPTQIASEFHAMKSRAENLFSAKQISGFKVANACSSPGTSRPTTPESSHSQLSRPPSLVFSSADSDSDEETPPEHSPLEPAIGAKSHKRSHSVTEDAEEISPPAPIYHPLTTSHSSYVAPLATATSDVLATGSRKRRMSDTGPEPSHKRRRPTNIGTRPQTVSAPVSQCAVTSCLPPSVEISHSISAVPVDHSQTVVQGQSNLGFDPVQFEGGELSQYVNISLADNTYCDSVPACGQGVGYMWANGDHPLSEIIRDAPSSTTLKLLPLPHLDTSGDGLYSTALEHWNGDIPPLSTTVDASVRRDLPPIHWSSSSLAGALGSPDQEKPALEPSTTLLAGVHRSDMIIPLDTQDRELQTSAPSSLEAILSGYSWNDPLEDATLPVTSKLEGLDSIESTDLQQLLDLLESPQYAGFAF